MNWQKLHPILHLISRYFLATIILMYAVAKIMGTQFSTPPSVYDKALYELNGFQLTWYYFGYSKTYGIFIAASQILAAFFLFFRQTTRMGIVLYLSIMVNILILDFAYDIPGAKGMAITLCVVALFVLLSDFQAFYNFFITAPPRFELSDRPSWMNKLQKFKFAYIPLVIIGLFVLTYTLKNKIMTKNEFYGAWEVDTEEDWSRIYFQEASTFSIRKGENLEEVYSGKYQHNPSENRISLWAFEEEYANSDFDILNPDSTKMYLLLEGDYNFEEQTLNIDGKQQSLLLNRLR